MAQIARGPHRGRCPTTAWPCIKLPSPKLTALEVTLAVSPFAVQSGPAGVLPCSALVRFPPIEEPGVIEGEPDLCPLAKARFRSTRTRDNKAGGCDIPITTPLSRGRVEKMNKAAKCAEYLRVKCNVCCHRPFRYFQYIADRLRLQGNRRTFLEVFSCACSHPQQREFPLAGTVTTSPYLQQIGTPSEGLSVVQHSGLSC